MSDEREIEDLARELRGVWLDIGASADRIGPSWLRVARHVYPRLARPAPESMEVVRDVIAFAGNSWDLSAPEMSRDDYIAGEIVGLYGAPAWQPPELPQATPSVTRVEFIDESGRVFVAYLPLGFSGVISMRGAAPDPVAAFSQAADAFTTQHTASEDAANACLVEAGIQDASGDLTAEYQENPAGGEKE